MNLTDEPRIPFVVDRSQREKVVVEAPNFKALWKNRQSSFHFWLVTF